jgi:zinc-ribbon domain
MMSSESSTERSQPGGASGIQPWHFYFILAMGGATWAVVASRHTQPAALLLLSAAILAAGAAGVAMHRALAGFLGLTDRERAPLGDRTRLELERQKALVLRSIKELEFDHAMRKVSEADFEEMSGRLRLRAMSLMQALEAEASRPPAPPVQPSAAGPVESRCSACSTPNDPDARFCKHCGARLA